MPGKLLLPVEAIGRSGLPHSIRILTVHPGTLRPAGNNIDLSGFSQNGFRLPEQPTLTMPSYLPETCVIERASRVIKPVLEVEVSRPQLSLGRITEIRFPDLVEIRILETPAERRFTEIIPPKSARGEILADKTAPKLEPESLKRRFFSPEALLEPQANTGLVKPFSTLTKVIPSRPVIGITNFQGVIPDISIRPETTFKPAFSPSLTETISTPDPLISRTIVERLQNGALRNPEQPVDLENSPSNTSTLEATPKFSETNPYPIGQSTATTSGAGISGISGSGASFSSSQRIQMLINEIISLIFTSSVPDGLLPSAVSLPVFEVKTSSV